MPLDSFPLDGTNRIIQQLARRVAALEAQAGVQAAVEVGRASGPFFLPNSTPTGQTGGLVIGASSGQFKVADQFGNTIDLPASHVANQDSFVSSTIAGSPTASDYNLLRTDAVATRAKLFEVQTSLRAARAMKSS
jgi:hypothetical protein